MPELITELRIAGLEGVEMDVEAFRGTERLSEVYQLELTVLVDRDAAIEERALEREAWLSLRRGEEQRVFHGVLADVELRGFRSVQHHQRLECKMTLVPRAWLMSQRRTSRIFQNLRVDEVIQAVLAPYFIPSRWVLDQRYPARAHCTQLEETDLEFVTRLCAEAGIFFFFENPLDPPAGAGAPAAAASEVLRTLPSLGAGVAPLLPGLLAGPREVMVFADNEHAYPPMSRAGSEWRALVASIAGAISRAAGGVAGVIAAGGPSPALHVRGDTGALDFDDEYGIIWFRRRRSLATKRFTFREYDPDRPNASLTSTRNIRDEAIESLFGAGRSTLEGMLGSGGRAALDELDQLMGGDRQLERYDHHSEFLFPDWQFEQDEARRMSRATRRRVDLARSESICVWLEPGRRFHLEDHELTRLNQEYVVVEVTHELGGPSGRHPGAYRNTFECVPADVAYVPQRPEPRRRHVCLTATVQSAEGSQIHTDSGGHVKVKFHWDRGQHGQRFNTCWIRVMQPWAGPGFGTMFLPREGSEVVVTFEGGDPDRPLILGSVYNAASPPPAPLPTHKTKTGIRTSSTPGGQGANELWFEDAAGCEQIYIHAQRDLEEHVMRDRNLEVRNDEHIAVEGRREERVRGAVALEVGRAREVRVGEEDTLRVEGDRLVTVRGTEERNLGSDRTTTITGADRLEVNGARDLTVRGDSVARHEGNITCVVGGPEAQRSAVTHVEGSQSLSATRRIEITADEEIVLRCADSVLRLTPDTVEIASATIVLQGEGARLRLLESCARLQADDRVQAVAEQVLLTSSGAALGLSSEAALDGDRVLLNSPATAEDPIEDEPVHTTTIELLDQEGNPIPNQPYRIVLSDGSEVSGVLDADGRAEIELDEDGDVYFPGVSDLEGA